MKYIYVYMLFEIYIYVCVCNIIFNSNTQHYAQVTNGRNVEYGCSTRAKVTSSKSICLSRSHITYNLDTTRLHNHSIT